MKAFIFAAGLGTRLRPLTNDRPKALVELGGKALLQHAIEYLQGYGINDFVINIHHFGTKVLEYLEQHNNFGSSIQISDEREALLETGGGLAKAAPLLLGNSPIVLYNVDVLSNLDLNTMLVQHQANQAIATLAIRQRESSRYLLFDKNQRLCGWKNTKTQEERIVWNASTPLQAYAFSGIHIIEPTLLSLLSTQGAYSITTAYLDLAADKKLIGYLHNQDYWFDVGKPERLKAAASFLNL